VGLLEEAFVSSFAGGTCLVDPRSLLKHDFGSGHVFKIHRLGLAFELIEAYGLADPESVHRIQPREATEEEACVFHSQGYLETLRLASSGMWVPNLFAHGLGTGDNPVFPDVYDWAMSVAGGSIDASKALLQGRARRAFNMSGGLHHAMPSRASGFCHVNDAVLAIHELLRAGKRVAYVDIDAHHGDGVEHAFYSRNDVLTISIHQSGYTIFPGSGFVEDAGDSEGEGFAVNIPLMPGAGDAAYDRSMEEVILPALEAFAPDVLTTQLGADAITGDVVANLQLSLRCFERCVDHFRKLDLPWLAFGGGGYNVGNVVRAWTLAWARMVEADLADEIPSEWAAAAASSGVAVASLRGPEETPPTSDRVMDALDATIEALRSQTLPRITERRPSS
jgi:acetoin utilization protein AcuC